MKKTHYVTIVPNYLAEQLAQMNVSLSVVEDFSKLSTIVSAREISFYYLTILHLRDYLSDTFNDMVLLSEKPNTLRWVSDHADDIAKAKLEFDKLFIKHKNKLSSEDVDVIVRCTKYSPKAINDDTLALVGFNSEAEYPYSKFLRDCITELNKQILFDQYRNMEVFRQYTRHA